MGTALQAVFQAGNVIVGRNSSNFDAGDPAALARLVEAERPNLIINAVAFVGVDQCEKEPDQAFRLNTLLPKALAELARAKKILLVQFSTDAVFDNEKKDFYLESDAPQPLNVYGFSKYGGDCFVRAAAGEHYIFRLPLLFGPTGGKDQFVEKMLRRIAAGEQSLKISADIICSPSYNLDLAQAAKQLIDGRAAYGLYHLANEGQASLFDLMSEIVARLGLKAKVEKASYRDFPYLGKKNTYTPIRSGKNVKLRPWREAVGDYCSTIKKAG